jgi:hypothetical protein
MIKQSHGHDSFSDMPGFMALMEEEEEEEEYSDDVVSSSDGGEEDYNYKALDHEVGTPTKSSSQLDNPLNSSYSNHKQVLVHSPLSNSDSLAPWHKNKSRNRCRRCVKKLMKMMKYLMLWLRTGNGRLAVVITYFLILLPISVVTYFFMDSGKLQ